MLKIANTVEYSQKSAEDSKSTATNNLEVRLPKDHTLYFVLFYAGVRLGLFTPDLAFDVVARKQIDRLRQPVLLMVDLVSQEVLKVVQASAQQVLTAMTMWPISPVVGGLP